MQMTEIFYGIFWVSAFSVIWFYTDWFEYYTQLLGIANKLRLLYQQFRIKQPQAYFVDFLYARSLTTNNRFKKFALKLISCPLCLLVWLSIIVGIVCNNLLIVAPIYIGALFVTFQIKKLL